MGEIAQLSSAEVEFQKSVFSLDDIKKAAYRLTNRAVFDFKESNESYHCIVKPKESATSLEELIEILKLEVLDQDLRTKIFRETEAIRNLILAHTFSNVNLGNE